MVLVRIVAVLLALAICAAAVGYLMTGRSGYLKSARWMVYFAGVAAALFFVLLSLGKLLR
jgi:hypothetical protein